VLYPAKASSQVTELYITAEKNKLYAQQGRSITNLLADRVEAIFEADDELTFDYNKRMAFGRWNHMMDQTHIGYTYWNHPPRNIMPVVKRIELERGSEMAIAIEGSTETWPSSSAECILPQFDSFNRESRYIDIFNKKADSFIFSIEAEESWIKPSLTEGSVSLEKRIWIDIDWEAAPKGDNVPGSIKISSLDGNEVLVKLNLFNTSLLNRNSLEGFIETNGYISIEAEHFTNKISAGKASWECIPDYGRTLSSMAVFPVTVPSVMPPQNSPCLEYKVYIVNPGEIKVTPLIAPTIDFVPGQGLRLGVSFDDQPVEIADFSTSNWDESVIYNIIKAETTHKVEGIGYHTLKIWMIDPIVVLQKILINTGGLKPSYLGAPESYFKGKKTGVKIENEIIYVPIEEHKLVLRPTLRFNEAIEDMPLVAQIGIFNRDIFSHSFQMTAYLYDDKDNLVGSSNTAGIIECNSKEICNFCYKYVESSEAYKLKVVVAYDGIKKEYIFELKAPKL
jgi:hypothetical protein